MRKKILAIVLVLSVLMSLPTVAAASGEESNVTGMENTQNAENEDILPENNNQSDDGESSREGEMSANGDEIEGEEKVGEDGSEGKEPVEESDPAEEEDITGTETIPDISYCVHIQTYGWQDFKKSGEVAGTTGQAKRLEAIELKIENSDYEGGIEYRTHVRSYGWQNWVSDGAISGTSGQAKRLEAIQIRLTGDLESQYDVYYRVHAQSYGWLGWAKNGEKAGTSAYGKRLEALEIRLTRKGQDVPGESANSYLSPTIEYQTHVQSYGWQTTQYDGATSGTSGQAKRLEAIKINLYETENLGFEGSITYRAHVQSYGWQDWVNEGELGGTVGQAKRLEAIEIKLTGDLAQYYSVYYRVHCQTLGWMGWACNGQSAGTEGFGKRVEAIEIRIVKNDSQEAPVSPLQAFVETIPDEDVTLFGRMQGVSENDEEYLETEISATGNGQILGNPEPGENLSGFGVSIARDNTSVPTGVIQYRSHVQSHGWLEWVEDGEYAGTVNEEKRLEAIQIKLSGDLEKLYNIYYRTYVDIYGWLGWTSNGQMAGSTGYSRSITAIQIQLVPKYLSGPNTSQNSFVEKTGAGLLQNPCPTAVISDEFGGRTAPTAGASTNHKGRDYAAGYGTPIYAAGNGIVQTVSYNSARGNHVIISHGQGLSTLYQHCSKINVKVGQTILTGAKIAEVGSTGISTGPHLHFEVWVNGTPVDPRIYL